MEIPMLEFAQRQNKQQRKIVMLLLIIAMM